MYRVPSPHVPSSEELLDRLESDQDGLEEHVAQERLESVGPNRLPSAPPVSPWAVLLHQFQSPLIYVLAAAAVVSTAIGEMGDAGFIAAVLAINAIIGGIQEWKAEKSSRALQQLLRVRATVLRDGIPREVDAEGLVPGDVVWLESGNRVPADVRLLSAEGLEVDESLLTGESLPVTKDLDWQGSEDTPVSDRRNMAWAGSVVARGRARAVVTATGSDTEMGKLARSVTVGGGKPPLLVRMERFTRVIGITVLVAALLVGVFGVLVQGQSVVEMFLFAVALAVSAIPEGLPVAMTVALAVATNRMVRRGVIVRRLAAVEGLGSCTLVATDKTGTLTCNELTVVRIRLPDGSEYEVSGQGYRPEGEVLLSDEAPPGDRERIADLARVAALCNEATLHRTDDDWTWRGDPTDVALLAFAWKAGCVREEALVRWPEASRIPFESERRFAASFHAHGRDEGPTLVVAKGGPERILEMCAAGPEGEHDTDALLADATDLASRGYRVLGLAEAELPRAPPSERPPPEPSGLRFVGFVGMIDPPRPGVREAIAECHEAGVGVVMVTGDHPVTAVAIARELGIAGEDDEVITGAELAITPTDQLADRLTRAPVYARVSPGQKLDIVRAAREAGHFVAVTGDGVNDAPALRQANIGVAMGRSGTDVARESAELVLTDDDFSSIVAGVEEGRVAYDNVRKVIYLLISTGAAEVLLVGLSLVAGMPLPLLPVQLLWLNLVTNGIQDVALAFEPAEEDVLRRPPRRPDEPIFERLMIERTLVGAGVMGLLGFGVFRWLLDSGWEVAEARNALLLLMVLFENVHIGNCRSETRSLFKMPVFRSPILLAAVLVALGLHVVAMYAPGLGDVLGASPLPLETWLVLFGVALLVAVAMEIHKWTWARRSAAA
ncbi:MAG: cation-translocating P-type ATPase [Myxococcota bacterium]